MIKKYSFEGELLYKNIQNRIDYVDGATILQNNNIEQVIPMVKLWSRCWNLFRKKTQADLMDDFIPFRKQKQKTPERTFEEPGIINGIFIRI
jgi:hypothetical protein